MFTSGNPKSSEHSVIFCYKRLKSSVIVFHENGYSVIAADLSKEAVSVYDTEIRYPVLLVIGGEKRGIGRSVLEQCDKIVALNYGRRFGAALSAASAASILAFEIFRQNRGTQKDHE